MELRATRGRLPSGDVPIPESVFVALASLETRIVALEKAVADLAAHWRSDLVKQLGAIALATLTLVGAVIAARPTLPAPEIRAVKSLVEVRIEQECVGLARGSQPRAECVSRIVEETQR